MLFKRINQNQQVEDHEFDRIYPKNIRKHSKNHFTPVMIAREAARFLSADGSVRVLDVGSGAGKFCSVASACSKAHYTGVEQRISLHRVAQSVVEKYSLDRVEFIHANILEFSFRSFDAIYFFNSFQENISPMDKMNDEIELDRKFYKLYGSYLKEQLEGMLAGTRLVTYHGFLQEIPSSFQLQEISPDRHLRMWAKIK
jgi:SAM-dependent methyltransferase